MKKLILLAILSIGLSACSTLEKNDITQEDLDKALEFAQCSQACYTKIYGKPSSELPAE